MDVVRLGILVGVKEESAWANAKDGWHSGLSMAESWSFASSGIFRSASICAPASGATATGSRWVAMGLHHLLPQ
jgi:hypothetical protein